MRHEPLPDPAIAQVADKHRLHRDIETRSTVDLTKVGVHVYANDPTTGVICLAFAVDDGPVQRWFPGDPVPEVWFEAAENPNWTAVAHNDAFESAIEERILHPRHGFPIIPAERHHCTQAAALALGLPAKLGLLADAMEFTHRKDKAGEKLMHLMSKPRKPRFGEDPGGIYWNEDADQVARLSDYNVLDVEVEREADDRFPSLSDAEQEVWLLSNKINARGFHVDREFALAARAIAQAAGPEINAELAEITGGAVETVNQIQKMKDWLKTQGCDTSSLDKTVIEELLEGENLTPPVCRVLELRAGGAQAAVNKINTLLAHAGADDRIRGSFRFHGAHTGRWSGVDYQPQNLKKPETEDLDAAIAAVASGDYQYMKTLYPRPLAIVGDCSRATITAANGCELIGEDLSAIESRVAAWVPGEEWKLETYRRFDVSGDPRDEPYCVTACKIFGVPDGTFTRENPKERKVGKTCELSFQFAGALGAWRKFEPDRFTDEEVEIFKREWRAAHPKIVDYWEKLDTAAIRATYRPGTEQVCGPVVLKSDDKFLQITLPSGRKLSYPNPRLIVDDRDRASVVYDVSSGSAFKPCRGGRGTYGGMLFENVVSGISRDILVEAMFRIEAAGYPIVLHIHDEVVCEVPIGFGSEKEFIRLMTQPPSWAPDLPIAANAWRGYRYDKSEKPAASPPQGPGPKQSTNEVPAPNGIKSRDLRDEVGLPDITSASPDIAPDEPTDDGNGRAGTSVSFTRFKARGARLSKHYARMPPDDKIASFGDTQMSKGEYETIAIEASDPPTALAEIGVRIDVMGPREAIGLGVVIDGLPQTGEIATKAAYERRLGNKRATATGIPRALSHFDWPSKGLGLLLFDGDERDGLREILIALYPDFAKVAALVRPSASASVKDHNTGLPWKIGEHLFVLLDEPAKAKACLQAVLRLSWCIGVGRSAGWLELASDGDPLVYGPCDVTVASAERLVYEGEISLGKGLERLPRNSTVIGEKGILCAAALIAVADKHAPVKQFNSLVAAAKSDPAFLEQQAAVKAAYRADHIEKGVAQGKPREEVEKEFDRVTRAAGSVIGERIWRELSPHQVLYFPHGQPFLASDMADNPKLYHGKECADPVEGLSYKSRNPGLILHQGGRVEIYSRAHSDRYAYFLPLFVMEELAELLRGLGEPGESAGAASLNTEAEKAKKAKAKAKAANDKDASVASTDTMSLLDQITGEIAQGVDAPDLPNDSVARLDGGGAKETTDLVPIEVTDLVVIPPSGGGGGNSCGSGGGSSGPQPGFAGKTKRIIKYGPLSDMIDDAEEVLIDAGVPFYQRGKSLVRPVVRPAQTFHGKKTTVSQLVGVDLPYLRDTLCQNSCWVKFDGRTKRWRDIHPPAEVAQGLLARYGDWNFLEIAGICSTPTLRPDGTILQVAGYDPATQLLLIDPPAMPVIPDEPTFDDALAALELLGELLVEFRFDDDSGVSRAVALSAMVSTVCRGAYPVVPMHIVDAPAAGSGKSYLLSLVSLITTGQEMPILGTGRSEEEMEKRIGAAILSGQTLICIDNVVGEIGGQALCQLIEQHRPSVRILGKSINVEARGTTFFANGNNIIIVGDLYRRVVRCRLDAKMERPEKRNFSSDPKGMILANRGKYIAACLTIARAYIAAGRPNKRPQLGSFNEWSDTVRSALVWLGEADPVSSQDASLFEDPEVAALLNMLNEWKGKIGTGQGNGKQMRDIMILCDANKATPSGKEYINKGLREAVLAVMPVQHHLKPDARALGSWLRSKKDRRIGKLRFCNKAATGHTPTIWWVEEEK